MRLEQNSYVVHEASYGSRIGENTDIFDWLPKFRDHMEEILTCDSRMPAIPVGRRNNVVVFKSCFPNNNFRSEGGPPGNAAGPDLTVWNARAAYTALRDEFQKHPGSLVRLCYGAAAGAKSAAATRVEAARQKSAGPE